MECLNVGDGRKNAFDVVALGDRGEQRSDSESDPGGDRVDVEPERDPRSEH